MFKFGISLLLLAGLAACNRGADPAAAGPPAMPVKVEKIQDQSIGNVSEYVATIKSRHSATIMSDVEGWIFGIHVHSGQTVHKGDTLMEIDPRQQQATVSNYDAQRRAKEATLAWNKAQFDRTRALAASGVVSRQDLDQAQSNYDAAAADVKAMDAQIESSKVALKYYSVFAPTDGVVGDVPVHVGDRVTNTTALTTIDERSGLEVYISIPSEQSSLIKMGSPVEVVDSTGKVLLRTNVYFISEQVESGTQSILAKAPADKAADILRNLQLVRARIQWSTHAGVTVPVVAVTRISGQYFAFIVQDENGKLVAHQRPLELGEIVDNNYVVQSGLKPGEQVVVAGAQNLAEGTPVRIEQ
jgi:RND family efflux transporter MFP subunit